MGLTSADVAASFIGNIPKLENVAKYVALSRRGFDGSGFPKDGPIGEDIPLISRLLRINIDLAYLASVKKISLSEAGMKMLLNPEPYDADLLGRVVEVLIFEAATTKKNAKKMTVKLVGLKAGDQIVTDIASREGKLYLKKGMVLSDLTISRLAGLLKTEGINNSFDVLRVQQTID